MSRVVPVTRLWGICSDHFRAERGQGERVVDNKPADLRRSVVAMVRRSFLFGPNGA